MKKHLLKPIAVLAVCTALILSSVLPAFADNYVSSGNGATVYYDDGSRIEYNARGSSMSFYDSWGGLIDTVYDVQLTEAQFKAMYYSAPRSNSSSSSKSKYADASIEDAYWDSNGSRFTARWEADYQSSAKYTITLYRDGHKVTSKTSSGGKSISFTDAIASANKTGNYYFTVKAVWSSSYTDTEYSDEIYVDQNTLNRLRSGTSGSYSSPSGSGSGSAGPGSSPASTPGPASNTGWQFYNGTWKYLRPNGTYAVNCWELVNNKWYYFDGNGNMFADQWVQTDAWYYLGKDGDMQVNQWVQSKTNPRIWYYVGGDGRMVTNTVVNGWPINANGECYY